MSFDWDMRPGSPIEGQKTSETSHAVAQSVEGGVYRLGPHILVCGDSANVEAVKGLVGPNGAAMVFTDPPYGVDYKVAGGEDEELARTRRLKNDDLKGEEFDKALRAWFASMYAGLQPGGAYYACGGYSNIENYPPALKAVGLYFSQTVVWDKEKPVLGWSDFMRQYELLFYGWRPPESGKHKFYGGRDVRDLWRISKLLSTQMIHPSEKPVALIQKAIKLSSKQGDIVLDLFGGSGSTLEACHLEERQARVIELDPVFCDVIRRRWGRISRRDGVDAGDAL